VVLQKLHAAGVAFETVPDLCALAARKDPALGRFAETHDLRIAACFPRAVQWLFHAGGAPLTMQNAKLFNLRRQSAEQVAAGLLANLSATQVDQAPDEPSPSGSDPWMPWFPVIDYDRCGNCQECLSFCLFDVYGLDADGRVEVQNPDHCKTGCPACARVCPNVAIMFPKHDEGPVNGDVVSDEDMQREPVKVDLAALLDQDVHASLRARSLRARERFAAGPDPSRGQAERAEQLRKLQAELGIPDGVLPSSPCKCACQKQASGTGQETAPPRVHGDSDKGGPAEPPGEQPRT
jgi:NAD-dependent dihydropyrimidine dehydrogenase PreA subunit